MKTEPISLSGVVLVVPDIFPDERGFFMKVSSREFLISQGIGPDFVEDNLSRSRRNVVRGLHFQWDRPLGKLIRVSRGRAFLAAVDIRKKSATFKQWFGVALGGADMRILWAPPGIAAGFLALEDDTEIHYRYTVPHNPQGESVILWNDPAVGIAWPLAGDPIMSQRDRAAETLSSWLARPESDVF